jgi:hypothetical protein
LPSRSHGLLSCINRSLKASITGVLRVANAAAPPPRSQLFLLPVACRLSLVMCECVGVWVWRDKEGDVERNMDL